MVMLSKQGSRHTSIKQTICVGFIVIFWSFAGISPTYGTITMNLGEVGLNIIRMSPFSYSQELEFIIELQSYPDIYYKVIDGLLTTFHFDFSHRHLCILALLLYFVITNVLAYLMMKLNKSKVPTYTEFWSKVPTIVANN